MYRVEEGSVQGGNVLTLVSNSILESIGKTILASIGPTQDGWSMLLGKRSCQYHSPHLYRLVCHGVVGRVRAWVSFSCVFDALLPLVV